MYLSPCCSLSPSPSSSLSPYSFLLSQFPLLSPTPLDRVPPFHYSVIFLLKKSISFLHSSFNVFNGQTFISHSYVFGVSVGNKKILFGCNDGQPIPLFQCSITLYFLNMHQQLVSLKIYSLNVMVFAFHLPHLCGLNLLLKKTKKQNKRIK